MYLDNKINHNWIYMYMYIYVSKVNQFFFKITNIKHFIIDIFKKTQSIPFSLSYIYVRKFKNIFEWFILLMLHIELQEKKFFNHVSISWEKIQFFQTIFLFFHNHAVDSIHRVIDFLKSDKQTCMEIVDLHLKLPSVMK